MKKPPPGARRYARRFTLQALYQWQLVKTPINELEAQFLMDVLAHKMDSAYFHELLNGIVVDIAEVDGLMANHLDRSIDQLDPVELAILRIGSYELTKRLDIPYRVVINEALELAKTFGATESHKYINGVLDKIAHKTRSVEIGNFKK